jgi:hypothetical protein
VSTAASGYRFRRRRVVCLVDDVVAPASPLRDAAGVTTCAVDAGRRTRAASSAVLDRLCEAAVRPESPPSVRSRHRRRRPPSLPLADRAERHRRVVHVLDHLDVFLRVPRAGFRDPELPVPSRLVPSRRHGFSNVVERRRERLARASPWRRRRDVAASCELRFEFRDEELQEEARGAAEIRDSAFCVAALSTSPTRSAYSASNISFATSALEERDALQRLLHVVRLGALLDDLRNRWMRAGGERSASFATSSVFALTASDGGLGLRRLHADELAVIGHLDDAELRGGAGRIVDERDFGELLHEDAADVVAVDALLHDDLANAADRERREVPSLTFSQVSGAPRLTRARRIVAR